MGGDAQALGSGIFVRYAGLGPEEVPAAGVAEDLEKAAAVLLGDAVDVPLGLLVPLLVKGEAEAQNQRAAADGAADLLVAAAQAAAEAAQEGQDLLRRPARQTGAGRRHGLGAVPALLVILIRHRAAIHKNVSSLSNSSALARRACTYEGIITSLDGNSNQENSGLILKNPAPFSRFVLSGPFARTFLNKELRR